MTPVERHAAYWKRVGDRQQKEVTGPAIYQADPYHSLTELHQMRMIEREEFIKTIEADRRAQRTAKI